MLFFDRDGLPITMPEWIEAKRKPEYVIVVQTDVNGGCMARRGATVSTVWCGWDQSRGESELPLIFETRVFLPDGTAAAVYSSDEAGARTAHAEAVDLVRLEVAGVRPN